MTEVHTGAGLGGAGIGIFRRTSPSCTVRPVHEREVSRGLGLAAQFLKEADASPDTVKAILRHNPHSFWGVYQAPAATDQPEAMIAVCGLLLLNRKGAAMLLSGRFDTRKITLEHVATAGDQPEIVYVWGIIAKGLAATAVPHIHDEMRKRYGSRPIYARAATDAGLRLLLRFGYEPAFPDQEGLGAIYRTEKSVPMRARALEHSRRKQRYRVVPVATALEFEQAMAIRTIFLTEQNCPYDEEFDGNDRSGTLFLGYVDGEPAATLRIRYFADFFKMERLAVLPRFRRTLIAKEVVLAAINFCRRKGYRKGFGFAQERYVPFWAKFGFKPTARNCRLKFSDYEYLEMYGELEPDDHALTMNSDPYMLIRPEGYWDEPGVLERKAARANGESATL